eukprot:4516429-Pyramimonas_sp.AAC.1
MEPRNVTCEECPESSVGTHANIATGAFGGAPYRATKKVRGVPNRVCGRMRTSPLGPAVERLMVPRSV